MFFYFLLGAPKRLSAGFVFGLIVNEREDDFDLAFIEDFFVDESTTISKYSLAFPLKPESFCRVPEFFS